MPITNTDLLAFDDLLPPHVRAARDAARALCERHAIPIIAAADRDRRFPIELVKAIADLGVLGGPIAEHGCPGLDALTYWSVLAELERVDSGLRSFASVQSSLVMFPIFKFGSDAQKAKWLPLLHTAQAIGCFGLTEPDAGSDPAAMRTRATKRGDTWILNGTKRWITNGTLADVAVIWARTDDDGTPIRAFLVERGARGFTQRAINDKQSFYASDTGELILEEVELSTDAVLPKSRGLGHALACLAEARSGIAYAVLGAAEQCLDVAIAYTGNRVAFGAPLSHNQLVQDKLAEMAAKIAASRAIAMRLAALKDAGQLHPTQISLGKMHNVRAALDVARLARELLGANGISDAYPVMRHMRNLETVYTYEGTHDIHKLVVGAHLTGHAAFAPRKE